MEKRGAQDDSDNGKRHPTGALDASCVLNEIAAAENRYFLRKTAKKLTNVPDASFIERSAAFEAVGRLESFSAAAEELMVTHCAVSCLVHALEKQLVVVLLERSRYGARTTTAGDRLLRQSQPAFELVRSGVEEISGTQKGKALTLSC